MPAKVWSLKKGGRYGYITARGKRGIAKTRALALKAIGRFRSTSKKSRKTTPKRRSSGGGGSSVSRKSFLSVSTIFKFIRLGALLAPGVRQYQSTKSIPSALQLYSGVDRNGVFSWACLSNAWLPYLASCLTTHGISKINGMIRRIK